LTALGRHIVRDHSHVSGVDLQIRSCIVDAPFGFAIGKGEDIDHGRSDILTMPRRCLFLAQFSNA